MFSLTSTLHPINMELENGPERKTVFLYEQAVLRFLP